MSDRAAVVMAVVAVLGALVGRGPVWWIGVALVLVALAAQRPWLLIVAVFLLTAGLAARAEAGMRSVVPGPFRGSVTLLSDPAPGPTGVVADVRLPDGRHLEARASGGRAGRWATLAAGQVATVAGRLERAPPGDGYLHDRHVVGRLSLDAVESVSGGAPPARLANAVRDVLERGAGGLPERQRALFDGFVLGDTRGQPIDVADDFRGAGLTHLLAVSGENVAFVLTLAGPLLRRLQYRGRYAATLAVIGGFAVVTRFEPSVLRASAMAALAATGVALGRSVSRLRLLALAVTALVVLDPFLVRVTGFQLSVGASLGIVVLAPRLVPVLRGPGYVRDALAVTLAAQAGVAPVLVSTFGGIPVATVPANLLAVPVAGFVMVWGVGAGMVAGCTGPPISSWLHVPTSLAIGWIGFVARSTASLPLGELRGVHLLVVTGGIALVIAGRLGRARSLRVAGVVAMTAAVLAPAVSLGAHPPFEQDLTARATLFRGGGRVLLTIDGRTDGRRMLDELRRAGVRRIDVVVVRTRGGAGLVGVLRRWGPVATVLTPPGIELDGALTVDQPFDLALGEGAVHLAPDGDRLEVTSDRSRGPPV